jgi:fructose-1,6-bisphosphatase I
VNVDPLDGSSNIDTNVSIGTIFSILPNEGEQPLLQPGIKQLAAGYIIYGPQTAMVLTVGDGTHIFFVDPDTKTFLLVRRNVAVPPDTKEYGVNSSNFRHWDAGMKNYKNDVIAGKDGPRKKDFNMRWIGSLVADAFRILTRGGVYIYPGDMRENYKDGRLRLLYEANPIGMIMEQAGATCSTGSERILEIVPVKLHQRVPLIFGSRNEVAEIEHQIQAPLGTGERSPLFGQRGLLRT